MQFPRSQRRRLFELGAAGLLALLPRAASAAERILIAGTDDAIAAQLHSELRASGFEPMRGDTAAGCSPAAVEERAQIEHALAAVCAVGDVAVVWTMRDSVLRLEDILPVRRYDARGADVLAVRVAEIVRATLELKVDPEPDGDSVLASERAYATDRPRPARVEPIEPIEPLASAQADAPIREKTTERELTRTPFTASAGASGLLGGGGMLVAAFSGAVEIGVHPRVSIFGRLDAPVESRGVWIGSDTTMQLAPGAAVAGARLLFAPPSSWLVPRIGAGFGVGWIATYTKRSTGADSDVALGGTMQLEGGASLRIAGPVRLCAESALGVLTTRIVERNSSIDYWGTPYYVLAARGEVQFR